MSIRRIAVAAAGMLMTLALPATAQRAAVQQDPAEAQLRGDLFEEPMMVSTDR